MELEERIKVARGGQRADLLLRNCQVIDVLSGRVARSDIAISGGIILGLDKGYKANQIVDLDGRYVAPGLMDAHIHIESSMLSVPEFARAVQAHGTTTVVCDCHEIANVMGIDGIRYMMESARAVPLDVFFMLPSCVPATPLETSGASLSAADLEPLMSEPDVSGLAEMMNFPGVINRDPSVMEKLKLFSSMLIDGHSPGLTGKDLTAYISAGPDSDHESTTADEMREKLRKGMWAFLREGTAARNLHDLLPAINEANSYRCCLCCDDRHPNDLLERGHIDSILKEAVAAGVSAVTAVRMATINTANRFRLSDRGAITTGRRADLVVFDDIKDFRVSMVFKDGEFAAYDGIGQLPDEVAVTVPPCTFDVGDFNVSKLAVEGHSGRAARVLGVVPGQLITESLSEELAMSDGLAVTDTARDVLKIAVVERHKGTGNVGVGFVKGFGLQRGALASSVAHDSHNIVVIGCSDREMALAVESVASMNGGQVAVEGTEVRASVALPIAGLMSDGKAPDVARAVEKLNKAAGSLGCGLEDPFMTTSFLALPVIPELKLTDKGLVDVGQFQVVPLYI